MSDYREMETHTIGLTYLCQRKTVCHVQPE